MLCITYLTLFLKLNIIDIWAAYVHVVAGWLSCAFQGVRQHPWVLPVRYHQL